MPYQRALYSGYAFENSRRFRSVPCCSVCVTEMCCTEGLIQIMERVELSAL